MLLEGKRAVVYGGGGAIGGAVSRAFAREGANVFLAGRTPEKLEAVADDIRAAGGEAETAQVTPSTSEPSMSTPTGSPPRPGGIDISFNLITHPHTHGVPLAEMQAGDFMAPIEVAARTTFLTARAAARRRRSPPASREPPTSPR